MKNAVKRDPVIGAVHGTIAAIFVLEQVGVPNLTGKERGGDRLGCQETWNGERVLQRKAEFMATEPLEIWCCDANKGQEMLRSDRKGA
jgi:hypothetical protein